jgi:hypothetical protein
MIGDTCKDIGEPGARIDIVEFRSLCRPPNYAERFRKESPRARIYGHKADL